MCHCLIWWIASPIMTIEAAGSTECHISTSQTNGWNSVGGIATRYALDGLGIESR